MWLWWYTSLVFIFYSSTRLNYVGFLFKLIYLKPKLITQNCKPWLADNINSVIGREVRKHLHVLQFWPVYYIVFCHFIIYSNLTFCIRFRFLYNCWKTPGNRKIPVSWVDDTRMFRSTFQTTLGRCCVYQFHSHRSVRVGKL